MGYPDVVLADRPLAYWRMNSARDLTGHGKTLTLNNGPTETLGNMVDGDPVRGKSFVSASSQSATVALDLSAYGVVAIEAWVWWGAQSTNTDLMLWSFGSAGDRFFFTPGSSGPTANTMQVTVNLGANNQYGEYAPFSGGTDRLGHHVVTIFNRISGTAYGNRLYVDGVVKTPSGNGAQSIGGTFPNSTLYLASYFTGALYGSCALQDVAVYGGYIGQEQTLIYDRVLAHYRAGRGHRRLSRPLPLRRI